MVYSVQSYIMMQRDPTKKEAVPRLASSLFSALVSTDYKMCFDFRSSTTLFHQQQCKSALKYFIQLHCIPIVVSSVTSFRRNVFIDKLVGWAESGRKSEVRVATDKFATESTTVNRRVFPLHILFDLSWRLKENPRVWILKSER